MGKPQFDVIMFFKSKVIQEQEFNFKKKCIDGLREIIKGDIEAIEIHSNSQILSLKDGRKYNWRMNTIDDNNFTVLTHLGSYEGNEKSIIEKYIEEDSIIFDIGANKGWYTILFGKIANKGIIYAFEPVKAAFKELQTNVCINNLNNVKFYNLAISNYVGQGEMKIPYNHSPLAYLQKVSINSKKNTCKVITIDQFMSEEKVKHVDFIKIDAEGSEYDILCGAKKLLMLDNAPIIFLESFDLALNKFGTDSKSVVKLLKSFQYRVFDIKNMSEISTEKETLDYSDTDLICFKNNDKI